MNSSYPHFSFPPCMSTLALPHQIRPAVAHRKPLSKRVEIGLTAVLVVIGLVLATLSLSYLFYANEKATQDYQLRVLQDQRAEFITKNEVLAMQIASLESLEALAENKQIANMVPAENLLYISGVSQVAKNE